MFEQPFEEYQEIPIYSQQFYYQQQKCSIFFQESEYIQPECSQNFDCLEEYAQDQDFVPYLYNPLLAQQKPRKRRKKQANYDRKRKRKQQKKKVQRKNIQNLKPKVKNPFSYFEDKSILLQVLNYGPNFTKIAKHFPFRTLSMVKNRYYKQLRYKWDIVLGKQYAYLNQQLESNLDTQTKSEEITFCNAKDDTSSFKEKGHKISPNIL